MSPLLFLALLAQSPEPFARARLEPGEVVTVGQPIAIVIEVLVPSYFMGAPSFPDLDIRDALVVFEPRGTNLTERIEGVTFAGQSRRYNVYPQRAGAFEIPEIGVGIRYFASGAIDATVSPPTVRFRATIPAEAEGLDPFIATTELTLEETFDTKPAEIQVGDAFTRTLTINVNDALSMVIPPIEFDPIDGIGVYPASPTATDTGGERGARIVGTRIESASYVAEKAGHYQLPEISLEWWDVRGAQRMTASVPAVDFDVIDNPALAAEIALPPEEASGAANEDQPSGRVSLLSLVRRYWVRIGVVMVLGWLLVRIARNLQPKIARAREERHDSESARFERFRDAALAGDPRRTARELMAWLDCRNDCSRIALFHDFAETANDPRLDREAKVLDALLYGTEGDETSWSGSQLYRRVAKARDKRAAATVEDGTLSPLNP